MTNLREVIASSVMLLAALYAGCDIGGVACSDVADKLCRAACDCTNDGSCRMTQNDESVRVYDSYDDCYGVYEDQLCGDGPSGIAVVDCNTALDNPSCTDDPEGSLDLDDACQ